MTASRVAPIPAPVKELIDVICAEYALLQSSGRNNIQSALKIGKILVDVKARKLIAHGKMADFNRRIGIPKQRACLYRRLAERFSASETQEGKSSAALLLETCSSIEEAVKKLAPGSKKRPKGEAGTSAQGGTKHGAGAPDEKLSSILHRLMDRIDAAGGEAEALSAARMAVAALKAKGFDSSKNIAISITPRKSASASQRREWAETQRKRDEERRRVA